MKSCLSKALVIILSAGACIAVAYYFLSAPEVLPVYNPSQINPELVDDEVRLNKNHRVASAALLDQHGSITDSAFTHGKIYVADFFFTTCQTICPIMTGKMDMVAQEFELKEPIRFLSFSVIPEEDSVPVLRDYANAYGVNYNQWRLLTGDKEIIYDLARKSYFTLKPAEVGEGDGGASDFIHTNNFVLVDSQKRIRGYYDGTSDRDMQRLIKEIKDLLVEEKENN